MASSAPTGCRPSGVDIAKREAEIPLEQQRAVAPPLTLFSEPRHQQLVAVLAVEQLCRHC
ncbi:MAG: hypothetical protein VKM34_12320 [Cyanobacteriota bacterium]|nr:hypothetical protein [Cyanobacteriota bacterium]